MKDILLTTINSKWIHPSLALRLLKANLGSLEDSCKIIEFALRQPLVEKTQPLLAAHPKILGISVSIWNHLAAIELLKELKNLWKVKPIIILGGPEVSHLPQDAEIFKYADYVIRGEGEIAFRTLCEEILCDGTLYAKQKFIDGEKADLTKIKSAYHLYTDEDVSKKLIYVESSRGCSFNCEFCLSSVADNKEQGVGNREEGIGKKVREFPLDQFFAEMDILIQRGVKTFKFLDRSFNVNIHRALNIINFFLEKIKSLSNSSFLIPHSPFSIPHSSLNIPHSSLPVVHFEMVPSIFPQELLDALAHFSPGTLRLEIGIQTFNKETAALINRPSNPEKELQALRYLCEKTNAIIHADLIAGLPGEDLESFGRGFDSLWSVMPKNDGKNHRAEIQLGILKLLPGAPISRHIKNFGLCFSTSPPYEIEETSAISADNMLRIKNFARFWEIIANRGLHIFDKKPIFNDFMNLSDKLFAHFGRNWGIEKQSLCNEIKNML